MSGSISNSPAGQQSARLIVTALCIDSLFAEVGMEHGTYVDEIGDLVSVCASDDIGRGGHGGWRVMAQSDGQGAGSVAQIGIVT